MILNQIFTRSPNQGKIEIGLRIHGGIKKRSGINDNCFITSRLLFRDCN